MNKRKPMSNGERLTILALVTVGVLGTLGLLLVGML